MIGDGVIEQRTVGIVGDFLEFLQIFWRVDAFGEEVVVVCRQAHQGQHFPVARIESDDDPAGGADLRQSLAQRCVGHLLQLQIQGQIDVVAGDRLDDLPHRADLLAEEVLFHVLAPRHPTQTLFHGGLDAGVPDPIYVGVIALNAIGFHFLWGNLAQKANHLCGELPRRIGAPRHDLDADARHGDAALLRDQEREVTVHILFHYQRRVGIKVAHFLDHLDQPISGRIAKGREGSAAHHVQFWTIRLRDGHAAVGDVNEARQALEDGALAFRVFWQIAGGHGDVVRRNVAHQQLAVAVIDDAPRRRDGHDAELLLHRLGAVIALFHKLQLPQAHQIQPQQQHDEPAHQRQPGRPLNPAPPSDVWSRGIESLVFHALKLPLGNARRWNHTKKPKLKGVRTKFNSAATLTVLLKARPMATG
ncbi:MAG: hypothetical protein BWY25_01824 [Chloroflexi bacterium ADurb.Bin222]|nr:MAG: hypothetical protein BWY25_01824 [Chloroflexi bacterium ADurb.Bin222]